MKLFRRRSEPPPLPQDVAAALAELQAIALRRPALAELVHTMTKIVPILSVAGRDQTAAPVSAARIAEKWAAGIPLLRGEAIPVDAAALAMRWQQLCRVVAPMPADRPESSLARMGPDAAQWRELLRLLLDGDIEAVHGKLESIGFEVMAAANILRWTVTPLLQQLRAALADSMPHQPWRHGYCPICGAWPVLGEFLGLEQVRTLRCGLCAMSWEYQRLRCPYCGADDHRQLGYLYRDGQENGERVATCDACRGYVKIVPTLTPLEPVRLLVLDVATLPLDLIAAERGYTLA